VEIANPASLKPLFKLAVAMVIIPPLMTLAEAVSLHTWDTPFLFLVGYLTLFGISFI
jgi:hypothetical protein